MIKLWESKEYQIPYWSPSSFSSHISIVTLVITLGVSVSAPWVPPPSKMKPTLLAGEQSPERPHRLYMETLKTMQ
jgi:hypothetical protein